MCMGKGAMCHPEKRCYLRELRRAVGLGAGHTGGWSVSGLTSLRKTVYVRQPADRLICWWQIAGHLTPATFLRVKAQPSGLLGERQAEPVPQAGTLVPCGRESHNAHSCFFAAAQPGGAALRGAPGLA